MKLSQLNKIKKLKPVLDRGSKISDNIDKCVFCTDQKRQITECLVKHKITVKSYMDMPKILNHYVWCSDCKAHLELIKECERNKHK